MKHLHKLINQDGVFILPDNHRDMSDRVVKNITARVIREYLLEQGTAVTPILCNFSDYAISAHDVFPSIAARRMTPKTISSE
ncbi:hypothetical protein [uncultured Parasutterella sp.]|uniref:hypothetical protein n=1 Tax=uncultured Parasutterella sp. TaxID=1263098 RepID=UPI0025B70BF2|nr:hypothetical protein [uncultured Parasutterella sp.]